MRSLATRRWAKVAGTMVLAAACACMSPAARAQSDWFGFQKPGKPADQQPQVLKQISVQQRLNSQLPLNLPFVDETGKTVQLGDYFGKKPVILSLVYFQCKILCPEEIDGLVGALEMVKFNPGHDFNVVLVSIDPTETPAIAAREKAFYMKRYGRPGDVNGWHFLTGQEPAIKTLASAVGFGYMPMQGPDGQMNQFAHASAVELATPDGKLAQYYLGVEYSPKDMMLGLIEASGNKIGSPVANILTYCYHYDPTRNKHSIIVARVVQLSGMVTVVSLGSFMFVMFRRDIRLGRDHDILQPTDDDDTSGAHKG